MLRIDMHTHLLPSDLPAWSEKFGYGEFIHLLPGDGNKKNMMKSGQFFRAIEPNCWDPEIRIQEYENHKTQIQVVCTVPVMFNYWAKPEHGAETSRFLNDHLAEVVDKYPRHYLALGTVPMQDVRLAIQELERCKLLGMPGIQIGSNINNINLGDPSLLPFFEACEQLNMCLLVHPWEMMGEEHMKKYWLPWLVGMPAETTRAICSMVFSGIFDKLPRLRVCFAHAGGSFIPTLGRIEHGHRCRPDLVAIDTPQPPSSYLGKFWVDNITHDPKLLEWIIDAVGSEKVTLGSDYPFPLGDLEIGAFMNQMNMPESTMQGIVWDNVLAWLGIPEQEALARFS